MPHRTSLTRLLPPSLPPSRPAVLRVQVGSSKWQAQHEAISKLNLQVRRGLGIPLKRVCGGAAGVPPPCAPPLPPSHSSNPHLPLRQAHYNARTHSDEFVVELLVSLDRVKTLVHDLLAIEVGGGEQGEEGRGERGRKEGMGG